MVNYLITGATRGIGLELVKQLASQEQDLIIAGVRDPSAAAAKNVAKLSNRIKIVKIDSSVDEYSQKAVKELQSQGVDHIDVIIANAGVSSDWNSVSTVDPKDVRSTFNINVIGPLLLFQAFLPLLKESSVPKILFVSTAIASMGIQRNLPYKATSYGSSKAALNFVALRIAIEHPDITSVVFHPGLVETDMATSAQEAIGSTIKDALSTGTAITVDHSAKAIIKLAEESKIDTHSGHFFNAVDGTELPW